VVTLLCLLFEKNLYREESLPIIIHSPQTRPDWAFQDSPCDDQLQKFMTNQPIPVNAGLSYTCLRLHAYTFITHYLTTDT